MKIAIVLHLYYTDLWPYFSKRIRLLVDNGADLIVTLPEHEKQFKKTLQKDFKDVQVVVVENHGRDVWPFIQAITINNNVSKYDVIFKIHSKKSKHRDDGSEWLDDLVDSLIPKNNKQYDNLIKILKDEDTGIIGPSEQYLPLAINLGANGEKIRWLLRKKYSYFKVRKILRHSFDYGFFAGTMFWIKTDQLKEIINYQLKENDFDTEAGQIDGTTAHALERVFSLVTEINGKNIFEIDKLGIISQVSYSSQNIPEWSDLYLKKVSNKSE